MLPLSLQRGATLIEVLVTVLLLAFGLLGIAVFQSKAQVGTIESYQRAQAVVLLEDMQSRMSAAADASAYVSATVFGVEDSPGDCTGMPAGPGRDQCEWSTALRGAAETTSGNAQVGAMAGARGCIELVQARNDATGACTPGIYMVSIAWQGNHATKAPDMSCGRGHYGDEKLRRAIAVRVVVGTPGCKLI
jgi:type IV pilus assembly protein PilV